MTFFTGTGAIGPNYTFRMDRLLAPLEVGLVAGSACAAYAIDAAVRVLGEPGSATSANSLLRGR